MEDIKEAVRDKATSIEKLIIDLKKTLDKGDDSKPLIKTLNQELIEMKASVTKMQENATSRLTKSLADQYLETYNTLKRDAATVLKLLEEHEWKNKLLGSDNTSVDESFSDLLLKEEKSLDNSLKTTSSILESVSEVRNSLSTQKEKVEGVGDKVVRFAETLPGVNILLRKISRRKRLNAIVISLAVTLSVCVIIYLTFS
mmetsp:Transcript_13102/g.24494  ORF Transcript_13102/g.24494 Transcript_13102/m.24494 type:complete len:200 (-) Transcript_13102:13-612(-)